MSKMCCIIYSTLVIMGRIILLIPVGTRIVDIVFYLFIPQNGP